MIHDEGLLYFNAQEGCWKWELEAIQKLQPEEDVLELLLKKLQRLPEETLEIMKLAACIGNSFDLETLTAVYGKPLEETASCLMLPVREGLVLIASKYPETELSVYEFVHDRIQQAVYSLIRKRRRKRSTLSAVCFYRIRPATTLKRNYCPSWTISTAAWNCFMNR